MNQLLLGASIPYVLAVLYYADRKGRVGLPFLMIMPLLMAASAIWAIVPDLPRLLGMHALYSRLAFDPRCDLFYWHYTIDRIEGDSPWYGVGLVLMLGSVLFAAWRTLATEERRGADD